MPIADGTASINVSTLAVGSHDISVEYAGDGNYNASTFHINPVLVVSAATTSTTITGVNPASPSEYGQSVAFTAHVAITSPGGGSLLGMPVELLDVAGGTPGILVGQGSLDASGDVTITINTLTVGAHQILASFAGNTGMIGSQSASQSYTVDQATPDVTLALTGGHNPSVYGEGVTYTVTVASPETSPPAGPGGKVQFENSGSLYPAVDLVNGQATFALGVQPGGGASYAITAHYLGDTNYPAADSSPANQVVNNADTTTTIGSPSPAPVKVGVPVTIPIQVLQNSPSSLGPTGQVMYQIDTNAPVTVGLSGGTYTLTTTFTTAGTHTLTVSYLGAANQFNVSQDSSQIDVQKVATTTTVTSITPATPALYGQQVTFTAAVSASSGTPTGSVDFYDGDPAASGVLIGSGTLSSGTATYVTPAGTYLARGPTRSSRNTRATRTTTPVHRRRPSTTTSTRPPRRQR